MKTERSSKVVEGEMEALKEKIRALEAKKQAHAKTIDKARDARKAVAFKAHADGDDKAAAVLTKSRENELRAAMELEDIVNALSEGRVMLDSLEREWRAALDTEAWAALLVEAETAQREAGLIDQAADALASLMGEHGKRLEMLKRNSHNMNIQRAFQTTGLRHVERILTWKMIQAGVETEAEKPGPQYREVTGYAAILAEQITAAKAIFESYMKERQANEAAEAEAETAEGASA